MSSPSLTPEQLQELGAYLRNWFPQGPVRRAIDELMERWPKKGERIVLMLPCRTGKTTLLQKMAQWLKRHGFNGTRVARSTNRHFKKGKPFYLLDEIDDFRASQVRFLQENNPESVIIATLSPFHSRPENAWDEIYKPLTTEEIIQFENAAQMFMATKPTPDDEK